MDAARHREVEENGSGERPAGQVQHQDGVVYLRTLPRDDDVERREKSRQDGAQVSHQIIVLGMMHLKEEKPDCKRAVL